MKSENRVKHWFNESSKNSETVAAVDLLEAARNASRNCSSDHKRGATWDEWTCGRILTNRSCQLVMLVCAGGVGVCGQAVDVWLDNEGLNEQRKGGEENAKRAPTRRSARARCDNGSFSVHSSPLVSSYRR